MIILYIDKIEDFLSFLNRRIMDEVFYEIKEIKSENDLRKQFRHTIILHFLAKIEEYIVLYETSLEFPNIDNLKPEKNDKIMDQLHQIINKAESSISLVKGKIREIFLSYSS